MASGSKRKTQINFLAAKDNHAMPQIPTVPKQILAAASDSGPSPILASHVISSRKRLRTFEGKIVKSAATKGAAHQVPDLFMSTAVQDNLRTRWESPWNSYEPIIDLQISGTVTVAQRRSPAFGLVHVKEFPSPDAEKALYMYRQIQDENFVAALDAFTTDDSFYIILEHMSVSLAQTVMSPRYPNERMLAAIIGQVSIPVPEKRS